MKKLSFLLVILAVVMASPSYAGNPQAGKIVDISDSNNNDMYLAGETVKINAPIRGDVVAAGGKINVNEPVDGDLLLAGGEIFVTGNISDDIRVFGGTVNITSAVTGDVVAFGGTVNIKKGAVINGDVIVAGGDVNIEGNILGNLKASGGNVRVTGDVAGTADFSSGDLYLNNIIGGDVKLAANTLSIGDKFKINGNLRYWTEAGEFTELDGAVAGTAVYDASLHPDDFFTSDWRYMGFGYAGFLLFATLASVLLAFLLIFSFNKVFEKSGNLYKADFFKNFGYGILYIIGIPFIIVLLMITVIGIPLGIMFLIMYIFTLIFGQTFASVVIAYWSRLRFHKHWNKWMLLLISAGIFILLNLLLLIPIAGWLASIIIIGAAFGAIILAIKRKKPAAVV